MEGDGIDGEHVADVAIIRRLLTVTFEREVVVLVFVVDVLDRAAAFDAADCESRAVCEGAADSRLPFERRLDGLEEVGRVLEVDDVDHALCGAHDEHFVAAHVHGIDPVFALDACDWLLLAEIPVFDRLVPGSGDEHGTAVVRDRFYAANGLVVRSNLLGLRCASSKIQHACGFICSGAEDLLAVLRRDVNSKVLDSYVLARACLPCSNNSLALALHVRTMPSLACLHSDRPHRCGPSCPNSQPQSDQKPG